MAASHHIHLVTSDQPRNGKTLLARALADCLLASRAPLRVLDCDGPQGRLSHWFNDRATILDPSRTEGQVKLFDGILDEPGCSYVIDLPARHLAMFTELAEVTGFLAEARRAGLGFTCWYILDRELASFRKARAIWHATEGHVIPVRNEAVGSYADTPGITSVYGELAEKGELTLPGLSGLALGWLDNRAHSLQQVLRPAPAGGLRLRPPSELFIFMRGLADQLEEMAAP